MTFPLRWQQIARMRLLIAGVLLALCSAGAGAQTHAAQGAPVASLTQTVWGVLGYARWPGQPETLQLCLVGETPYAAALQAGTSLPDGRTVQVRRIALEGSTPLHGCHAVYAGRLHGGQWQQLMTAWPKSQPLLTLSEDPGACQQGGMFCLDVSKAPVSFELSLDSVARSGVRVSPKVLSLARNREGG
jgi:hypothetical protein